MTFLSVAVLSGWVGLLLNLLLTLRIVRYLRAEEELREGFRKRRHAKPLAAGSRAPDFRARTLDGDPIELSNFVGCSVVFVYVSPHCPSCQRELRGLVRLGRIARHLGEDEIVLVSDEPAEETTAWLTKIRDQDGVTVDLPVVVAPLTTSDFLAKYNSAVITPYYCHINADGTVVSSAPLGDAEWPVLRAKWERGGVGIAREVPA